METKAAKKRRLVEEENERNGRGRDRFSDLPNEISNHILLLTHESHRTSKFYIEKVEIAVGFLSYSRLLRGLSFHIPGISKENFGQIFYHQMSAMRFISSVLSGRHENSDIKLLEFCWFA